MRPLLAATVAATLATVLGLEWWAGCCVAVCAAVWVMGRKAEQQR